MTDTPRTRAELLALFPDNVSGLISPQDVRDLVVSLPSLVFEARLTAPQSIANSAPPTRVAFDTIGYDPHGFWSGTWPIVPAGMQGDYLVACSFAFAANSSGNRVLDISTDTPDDPDGAQWAVAAAASPYVTAHTGSWVSKGNDAGFGFYPVVTQNSGGPVDLNYCTFTLTRLSA